MIKSFTAPLWSQPAAWWRVYKSVDRPLTDPPSNPRMLCAWSPSPCAPNCFERHRRTVDLCGKKNKNKNKPLTRPPLRMKTLTCLPEPLAVWPETPGWPGFRGPVSCWWPLWPSPSTPPQRQTWGGWLWYTQSEDGGGIHFKMIIHLC